MRSRILALLAIAIVCSTGCQSLYQRQSTAVPSSPGIAQEFAKAANDGEAVANIGQRTKDAAGKALFWTGALAVFPFYSAYTLIRFGEWPNA